MYTSRIEIQLRFLWGWKSLWIVKHMWNNEWLVLTWCFSCRALSKDTYEIVNHVWLPCLNVTCKSYVRFLDENEVDFLLADDRVTSIIDAALMRLLPSLDRPSPIREFRTIRVFLGLNLNCSTGSIGSSTLFPSIPPYVLFPSIPHYVDRRGLHDRPDLAGWQVGDLSFAF